MTSDNVDLPTKIEFVHPLSSMCQNSPLNLRDANEDDVGVASVCLRSDRVSIKGINTNCGIYLPADPQAIRKLAESLFKIAHHLDAIGKNNTISSPI